MKKQHLLIFTFFLLVIVGIGILKISKKESSQIACTMDAKMCSDGSYVGRTGPKCEFTECPMVKEGVQAKIGEKILNNTVYITPIEVVTDSRCPIDVTCIWAGEVKLLARVFVDVENIPMEQELTFTLGVPLNVSGKVVTLVEVSPQTKSDKVISASDYLFTFQVK